MKKTVVSIILLAGLAFGVFAQQEIPMFFDNNLGMSTGNRFSRLAYSPNGNRIATLFNERTIVIWDTVTGREITRIAGNGNHGIASITFNSNGRQLISCSAADSAVRIWDTTTGAVIRTINQGGVARISFSPDNTRILGTHYNYGSGVDVGIKVWNAANGNEILSVAGVYRATMYSPDGRRILTIHDNRELLILDAVNGQIIRTINNNESFSEAVYSPDGRFVAASTWNEETDIITMRIYNTETGQEIRSFPIGDANNHFYSPDGRQLLVNVYDPAMKIFDPETGRELRSFNNAGIAIAFSPDGRSVVANLLRGPAIAGSGYGSSCALFLDATTGRTVGTIGYGPLNIGARAYSDLQIARFLGDTAAVTRNEAILQFAISGTNVTRAEVEAFFRNGIRGLVSEIVDEEFGRIRFRLDNSSRHASLSYSSVLIFNPQNRHYTLSYGGTYTNNETREITAPTLNALAAAMLRTADFDQTGVDNLRAQAPLIPIGLISTQTLDTMKNTIVNFYVNPNETTYNAIRNTYARLWENSVVSGRYNTAFGVIADAYHNTVVALNDGVGRRLFTDVENNVSRYATQASQIQLTRSAMALFE